VFPDSTHYIPQPPFAAVVITDTTADVVSGFDNLKEATWAMYRHDDHRDVLRAVIDSAGYIVLAIRGDDDMYTTRAALGILNDIVLEQGNTDLYLAFLSLEMQLNNRD